ncbi:MAG: ATP/GTP-binding protein [Chryseolinea sp.]
MNQFRNISLSFIFCFPLFTAAQTPQLVKLWETDSTLKVPESVLHHTGGKVLFVSNIDGKSGEKDLKGSISKVSLDGKRIEKWAVNLSAPKGMGIYNSKLYVADIDEVVAIDLTSGKTLQRIPVAGAIFLNDLAIDKTGMVYVSDSKTGKILGIQDGTVSTYLENQMGVNGLLISGEDLYFVVKGILWKSDKNKMLTKITEGMDESTDGIVQTNNGFIVSCWNGIIYHITPNGNKQTLLDTRAQKLNTADIGFDSEKEILYVPTFFKNRVIAYQFK